MSSSDRSCYTPSISTSVARKRGRSDSYSSHSRSRSTTPGKKIRKRHRRNRSRSTRPKPKQMGRSRSRAYHKDRYRTKRTRRQRRFSSDSYTSATTTSLGSSGTQSISSSSSNDTTRRSRSRSRRSHFKYRARKQRSKERGKKHRSVMQRFFDILGNRGHNSYIGSHNVIPDFDPSRKTQSMKSWLTKVNETSTIYGWDDKQTVFHAIPKLAGLARKWYDGLSSINLSWREWQRKLSQNFPDDRNYADNLSEMLARKSRREETLEEYFYDKAKLVKHCRLKGKDAGANFKSPGKLLRYLRTISSKEDHRKTPVATKTNSVPPIPPNDKNTAEVDRNPKSTGTIICHNCLKPGHISIRCREEPQKCTKCNRMNHLAEYCRRYPSNEADTKPDTKSDNKENNTMN